MELASAIISYSGTRQVAWWVLSLMNKCFHLLGKYYSFFFLSKVTPEVLVKNVNKAK